MESHGKSSGKATLTVVPALGEAVDLAEYREMVEPMRIEVLTAEVQDGILAHDKRLGPPALAGDYFIWLIAPDQVFDPPLIRPYFEN